MENSKFQELLQAKVYEIEEILKSYLPKEEGYQKTVLEAMNYSLLAGGKRLRPMLMQETYRMFGGEGSVVKPFMAAMEMIHTYSLVHDDLPAMDNDEYRRGRKTTWSVYGDAMGILAGDGLLNYAFETALKAFSVKDNQEQTLESMGAVAESLSVLAKKAGIYGMIGGQTVDIEAENQDRQLSTEEILFVHEHKTAALIQASMMVGAILAGADKESVAAIEKCAYNIGIAFQIQDDVLDVIGDSKELGKMVGSDAQNNKQTYVTINGLESSRKEVERLSNEAVTILNSFPGEHEFLEALILQLIHRRN
ncbi:MAG: polyprenyl synthetase family protein [Lachnospiraceae bacterium]|nr:polyprenyl synthetase family protein [Lachnospiraceae bacterium]